MMQSYEYVVIGAGALGTATAHQLAKAGSTDVLVLEQFDLGHSKGASEDHSRIIRHVYHSETYTCLTTAMYEAWAEVEEESGLTLLTTTGSLELAVEDTAGVAELATYRETLAPGIPSESLDAAEIRHRWPQWNIEDDVVGLYQPGGGILDIRRACAAQIGLARNRGVTFLPNTRVIALVPEASHVRVRTATGSVAAEKVIVCTSAWTPMLLQPLGIDWNIVLSQEQVSYFSTPHLRDFMPDRFPMWIWHGDNLFYGFPVYGEVAVKIGRDLTGRRVTLETRSYEPDRGETEFLEGFLRRRIPGAVGPELFSKTCVYDMPPDRDFVLDVLPDDPRIIVGLGAGHAAKFASLIGKILAELSIQGHSSYPIDAFQATRPALTDPGFEPAFRMTGSH